jgi:hypothetical protein
VYSWDRVDDTEEAAIGKQGIGCDDDSLIEFEGDDGAACDDGTGDVSDGLVL